MYALLIYLPTGCNFCNHQIMVSITLSSSSRLNINYTWMSAL